MPHDDSVVIMGGVTPNQAARAEELLDSAIGQSGLDACEDCGEPGYLVVAYVPRGKQRYQMNRRILCSSCAWATQCGKIIALVNLVREAKK